MPVNVIAHDTRLECRSPVSSGGTLSIEVGDDTTISDFFDLAVSISDEHIGIETLYIMAHGVTVGGGDTHAIQFCHEMISYETVDQFARLRDKVNRIVFFVCSAAESDISRHGDGDELGRQIAFLAHAEVTAARETQAYSTESHCALFFCEEAAIEFGEWEGSVVVYGADGNLIAEYGNPSIWRDANDGIHDPRSEPDPRGRRERRREIADERFSHHSMRL